MSFPKYLLGYAAACALILASCSDDHRSKDQAEKPPAAKVDEPDTVKESSDGIGEKAPSDAAPVALPDNHYTAPDTPQNPASRDAARRDAMSKFEQINPHNRERQ